VEVLLGSVQHAQEFEVLLAGHSAALLLHHETLEVQVEQLVVDLLADDLAVV